jgi:RNA:NAD 2'-phosphotransferase (TPT1/KptA family)
MTEKILTLHPDPKKRGVRIDRPKYDQVKAEILTVMASQQPLTFTQLAQAVENHLAAKFEGSISWYTVSVKLDLEARGIIERIPGTRPEKLKLT